MLRSSRTMRRKEHLGLAPERLAQIVVEVFRVGLHVRQLAQVEPLAGEVRDQRVGLRIGQHAPHLPFEHCRIAQPALGWRTSSSSSSGMLLQRKNDRRDARSQIADPIDRAGPRRSPAPLRRGKMKPRRDQHARQRLLDAGLEVAVPCGPAGRTPSTCRLRRRTPGRGRRGGRASRRSAARTAFFVGVWLAVHTKIRRRLGVSPTPVGLNGPVIVTVDAAAGANAAFDPEVRICLVHARRHADRSTSADADRRAVRPSLDAGSCADSGPATFSPSMRDVDGRAADARRRRPPPATLNSYSASSGNVWRTSIPPRVPSGRPSM